MDINVLAELEHIGWDYAHVSDEEIRCKCPFHDDDSPSCHVNVRKRVFICQASGCNKDGDVLTLLGGILKQPRATILKYLEKRGYSFDTDKIIEADVIEKHHRKIWKAPIFLKALYERAITDDDIRLYRLGEDAGRITIPIPNAAGFYVNIRRYLPGAPGADKMRNMRGRSKPRLFPIKQLEYDKIVICGGEIKAIAAARILNQHGIGALCVTAGEGAWDTSFSNEFLHKHVWVCMDVDKGGRDAAHKICRMLAAYASWLGDVVLPLDPDKFPKGDINDFLAIKGDLLQVLELTDEWVYDSKRSYNDDEPINQVSLSQAVNAQYAGKRVAFSATITACDTTPYTIPKKVICHCSKDQPECSVCPVFPLKDNEPIDLHPENQAVLEMIASPRGTQREALKAGLGIPFMCRVCDFEPIEHFTVEDVRISPQLTITNRSDERMMQPAIVIDDPVELNESFNMLGRMHPHPKNQQSTLIISKAVPTQDALSSYTCDLFDELSIFEPSEWTIEGLQSKLDEVYQDIEANVTRIFLRRDMHLAIDLAYHSPLLINFDGRTSKGWVEALILGDSSQGKSETAIGLQQHYGLGEKVECKNASVAGLLGGLQQMGNRWFVTWGAIPSNDKRLVILEEVKGASTEVLSRLTDMRSSGVAEIPKIERRRTHARTRIVALSNPRSDHVLSTYNYGIEAVKELIGALEDVRRFDFAVLVGKEQIDARMLNQLQQHRPDVPHVFTSELSRALILWGWTRSEDNVVFEPDAKAFILKAATELSEQFTDAIPLVDRGSARYKIARLASSLAVRTFSHQDTDVLVRTCHAEFIVNYLRRLYSDSVMGYDRFTQAMYMTTDMTDHETVRTTILATPFAKDLVENLLFTNKIELQDIMDWCAWDRQEALDLMSTFVRKRCLTRDSRCYRKTPSFISFLKELLDNERITNRPSHIPEEF